MKEFPSISEEDVRARESHSRRASAGRRLARARARSRLTRQGRVKLNALSRPIPLKGWEFRTPPTWGEGIEIPSYPGDLAQANPVTFSSASMQENRCTSPSFLAASTNVLGGHAECLHDPRRRGAERPKRSMPSAMPSRPTVGPPKSRSRVAFDREALATGFGQHLLAVLPPVGAGNARKHGRLTTRVPGPEQICRF